MIIRIINAFVISYKYTCFYKKDVHIYFRVFHSENDNRYEAVPVVLKDDKLIEAKSVEDAILRRDD